MYVVAASNVLYQSVSIASTALRLFLLLLLHCSNHKVYYSFSSGIFCVHSSLCMHFLRENRLGLENEVADTNGVKLFSILLSWDVLECDSDKQLNIKLGMINMKRCRWQKICKWMRVDLLQFGSANYAWYDWGLGFLLLSHFEFLPVIHCLRMISWMR